ncbi:MAG: formylglycine-generating enzyme family protein [Byssovorax sp.]
MVHRHALPFALIAALAALTGCEDDPIAQGTSSATTTTSSGGGHGGEGGQGGSGGSGGAGGTTATSTTSTTGSGGEGGGTGGEGGTEAPGVIGAVGDPCDHPGEKGCAGHAQMQKVVCGADSLWAAAGTCAAGERCNSAFGPKQGTCLPVVPLCLGKSSSQVVCSGAARVQCGPDLVSSEILETCAYLCENGACVGDCTPMAKQCAGTTPQTCTADGAWKDDPACPYACSSGQCTGTCVPGGGDCMGKIPLTCDDLGQWKAGDACNLACNAGKCAGVCVPGSARCNGNTPEGCDGSGTWQAQPACPGNLPTCVAGACSAAPSCVSGEPGAGDDCGPTGTESCCVSPLVKGGTFNRIQNASYPATVSDFRLDRFEITVGRFRQFVNGYPGTIPKEGDGAHSKIPGTGWSTMWNASLPATHAAMIDRLTNAGINTWTNVPGPNENKPLNWLDWYMVFAFCAWDGGRLPTEAEWNYAAAGGSEQRYRPWGTLDLDPSYAVYNCTGDGSIAQDCKLSDVLPVGSRSPKGDGRWGQADLVGGVWEWNLDYYEDPLPAPCIDCANLVSAPHRSARGGSYSSAENRMNTVFRNTLEPDYRKYSVGGRCARNP